MSWTTPADLRNRLQSLWERGEWLRGLARGHNDTFPLRLALKGPSSAELAEHFEATRAWIAELTAAPRVRIEWREINHRILGMQRVPQAAWVDSLDDALALAGKRRETARFEQLLEITRARQPRLVTWLAQRPLHALELADDWERLLAVVDWMQAHPRPGLYLRVSFSMSVVAFDQRFERKDAHDLIYCIEHAPEGMDAVAEAFRRERAGKHGAVIEASLAILRSRFTNDEKTEGCRKDGPVSVAKFELGEGDEPDRREARALRQRQASDVIEPLLARIE